MHAECTLQPVQSTYLKLLYGDLSLWVLCIQGHTGGAGGVDFKSGRDHCLDLSLPSQPSHAIGVAAAVWQFVPQAAGGFTLGHLCWLSSFVHPLS